MVVLITGITSGFGRAIAERLSSEGHKVYGTHRRDCERIPGVSYIRAEVGSDSDCEAAVRQVLDAEGHIDVFISNAGMGIGGPLELSSLADARLQMDVNWMGMVRFLHHVVPAMRKRGSGKIICLSSIGGLIGLPFQGLYSASKFAIEGYCEALRMELRGTGVSVTVVEPGDFHTGFTASRKSVTGPEVEAAYPSYTTSLACIEHDETSGLTPDVLAARISRVLKRKNPPYTIVVANLEQKLSVFIKRILPKRWFAAILASYYKL